MNKEKSGGITTIQFEQGNGDIFRIGEMRQRLAILTFLRYVG